MARPEPPEGSRNIKSWILRDSDFVMDNGDFIPLIDIDSVKFLVDKKSESSAKGAEYMGIGYVGMGIAIVGGAFVSGKWSTYLFGVGLLSLVIGWIMKKSSDSSDQEELFDLVLIESAKHPPNSFHYHIIQSEATYCMGKNQAECLLDAVREAKMNKSYQEKKAV